MLFTQFLCEESITVPEQKLDIEDIVSVIVDPEIISLRIIDTPVGCSVEGQKLTGKKLSVEIKMKQKVMYVSQRNVQSVHVVENECYKSVFIVLPEFICGTSVEYLLNRKYIKVDIEVESASAIKMDCRHIYKTVALLIKAQVVPSYLLCYTEDYNCHRSELYVAYNDGSRKREITVFDEGKIIMPQWSPCGQKIAYICKKSDSSYLCVSDIKGNNTYTLTDIDVFKYVSSFTWSADGAALLFTAYLKDNKDIFLIYLNNLQWKQLTYGDCEYNNIKPKTSFDGEYIAYIRSTENEQNLCVMKKNGFGTKIIKGLNRIKEFCWEKNNLSMAVICHKDIEAERKTDSMLGFENNRDDIYLVDIKNNDSICLHIAKLKLKIKKVKISSDSRYISFIGESLGIEDIYLYDLLKDKTINLTENECNVRIGDYDWDIDSTGIYYSCNELNYYNLYFIVRI